MPGYQLVRQKSDSWTINDNYDKVNGIEQKWHIQKGDVHQNIHIYYCEFNSIAEAINGCAYSVTKRNAIPLIWGSMSGSIIGDYSWISINNGSIFFLRGNVGINIFKPHFQQGDENIMLNITDKIISKIDKNLSSEILSSERHAKQEQIPMSYYRLMTDPLLSSAEMSGFSPHKIWDSKWMYKPNDFTAGIRKEWIKENGAIISIDISMFDSDIAALSAAENQGRITRSCVFTLDNLDSLQSILEKWQND